MTMWIAFTLLLLLAAGFIFYPLYRANTSKNTSLNELNTNIIRQQIEELDNDLANGVLTKDAYDTARSDLERSLITSIDDKESSEADSKHKWIYALMPVLLVVGVLPLYFLLGTSNAVDQLEQSSNISVANAEKAKNLPSVDEMIALLEKRMAESPDNVEGLKLLARSYAATGSMNKAITTYKKVYSLAPDDIDAIISYADALAADNGNTFSGESLQLIKKAQSLDPQHPDVLWMTGIIAFQANQYELATTQWETLLALLPADNEAMGELKQAIAEAKGRAGLEPIIQANPVAAASVAKPAPATVAKAETAASDGIRVRITISDQLRSSVPPNALLFVFAKATAGPPMPLAAYRGTVADLPLEITLNDAMAMMPQMKLSGFPEVTVGARISLSGQPKASRGDLQGIITPVSSNTKDIIRIEINQVVQ